MRQPDEFLTACGAFLAGACQKIDRVAPFLEGEIGLADVIVQRLHQFFHQEFSARVRRLFKAADDGGGQFSVVELGHFPSCWIGDCGLSLHHGSSGGKRAGVGTRHTFRLSRPHSPSRRSAPMLAPTPASPESAGMSKAALDRVEAHLKHRYIDAARFPGTQMLVYRRGKIVHSALQGFADVERKTPMKDDTIFRIYSMTKPITSVAFMMLFEEGRVALD